VTNRILLPAALLCGLLPAAGALAAADHFRGPGSFAAQGALAAAAESTTNASLIYDINRLGLTLSNYGFIGTNLTSRSASFEYPLGSGHQHLVRGGPWVGAIAVDDDGVFTGVSAAAVDGYSGSAGAGATEFAPVVGAIARRSTLPNSRYFSPGAISEMDFVSRYSDRPGKRSDDANEDHRPLGVTVTQYNFGWSFSNYAHLNIFHYVIRNDGPPLRNVWLGMYDELASGNLNLQNQIPPSGWFNKKETGWVDSLNLLTERYCLTNVNFPVNCRYDVAPEIAGIKLLGVKPGDIRDTLDKRVTFAIWNWEPGDATRDEDVEKYAEMSSGLRRSLTPLPEEFMPGDGDPVTLLAVGPFAQINTGDSVTVDFAYIGALSHAEMHKRAAIAQKAYDLDYLVPVPPPSPRFHVVVRGNAIDFYWDDSPESFLDRTSPNQQDFEGYRVYLGESRDDLRLLAQFDKSTAPNDTAGFNTGFEAVRIPGGTTIDGVTYHYKYTFGNLRDGFKYWAAVTAYDLGTSDIESLESGLNQNEQMVVPGPAAGESGAGVTVVPNPYRVEARWDMGRQARDHYLWFANLPSQSRLKIYTLSGDLIYESDFDGASYDGRNARGIYRPASDLASNLSGSMFGWDLITRQGQAVASGLYLWAVEDKHDGSRQTGKFLIVKSDREDF
jgi:hypothetical protein